MRDNAAIRPFTENDGRSVQHAADVLEDIPPVDASTSREPGPSSSTQLVIPVQAEPLPSKRGEIGYREPEREESSDNAQSTPSVSLPERHPADRDADPQAAAPQPTSSTSSADVETASTHTSRSTSKRLLARFKPKHIPVIKGARITTLLLLVLQLVLFCGTIVGWVLVTNSLSAHAKSSDPDSLSSFGTTQIFVHVVFGIATLAQLIFVERRIYRVRAERWVHEHGPGLPMHHADRRGGGGSNNSSSSQLSMGLAPWNRPPLPTYAAALAQSGVGTGDVEDNAIAIAPPPAYGNTRGSQLLLSGMMSDALRQQRAAARAAAVARANAEGGSVRGSWQSGWSQAERPVSYASHDEEWEERRDAMRNAQLEETLARLEDAHVRN